MYFRNRKSVRENLNIIFFKTLFSFKERINQTDCMRTKLSQELCYLQTEITKLELIRDELEHATLMIKKPEDICIHNLKAREFRQGILT